MGPSPADTGRSTTRHAGLAGSHNGAYTHYPPRADVPEPVLIKGSVALATVPPNSTFTWIRIPIPTAPDTAG